VIHVWFILPDGNKLGRQVTTVPAIGDLVTVDNEPPMRVSDRQFEVRERVSRSKIVVYLARP
jgi:hypothetical protein